MEVQSDSLDSFRVREEQLSICWVWKRCQITTPSFDQLFVLHSTRRFLFDFTWFRARGTTTKIQWSSRYHAVFYRTHHPFTGVIILPDPTGNLIVVRFEEAQDILTTEQESSKQLRSLVLSLDLEEGQSVDLQPQALQVW